MKPEPLVSILAPAYRCAAFLDAMIASIRAQTYHNWELLIVDDGSDDDQAAAAEPHLAADRRVYFWTIAHGGYAAAFNAALAEAGGEIIARQDADDWSDPRRLELQVAALADADICTCGICRVDENQLQPGLVTGMHPRRFLYDPVPRGPGGAVCVAWRGVYSCIGGLDPAYEWSGDSDWYFRALLSWPPLRWVHVPRDLYFYRRHAGQMRALGGSRPLAVHRERQEHYRPLILARHSLSVLLNCCRTLAEVEAP